MNSHSMPAQPIYSGLSGALIYGLWIFVIVAIVAAIGAGTLWAMTGQLQAALPMFYRLAAFGGIVGFAAFLCRWIARAEFNSVLGLKFVRGDVGAFGAVAGLLAAGAMATTPWQTKLTGPTEGDKIAIGQPMQIAGPTVDGGQFDITENKGHVTVVDFWATWCGPCVKALPELKKLNEQFKDKGLRVIGVSLDRDKSDLEKFLVANPLPWKHIYFASGNNPLADRYGVEFIPHVTVIDRQGNVVADRVHGAALERAVKNAIDGSASTTETVPFHRRLLNWLMNGIFSADWISMTGYVIGGALIALGLELFIRSALQK